MSRRLLAIALLALGLTGAGAQEPPRIEPLGRAAGEPERLPINLPTALALARASPIDVALAGRRLEAALAQQQRARTLWLPTIYAGLDYARHDGQIQDIVGNVFGTDRQSLMFGA